MPIIDVVNECSVEESFRSRQARGMFDLCESKSSRFETRVEVPSLDESWGIGVIVGPSGSGKSSVARALSSGDEWPGARMVERPAWPDHASVLDGFEDELEGRVVFNVLNGVGFSSAPSWLRPYRALSNGEQFRCDLARALMTPAPVVMVDEFTSVVDRQVAHFGSAAIAKMIRRGQARCDRFVAVSCHYDILDWLTPDWWLDMANGQLARGCLQRPEIRLAIRKCDRVLWGRFARHHYLSANLHPGSRCYAACWEGRIIGFMATLHLMGKKRWRAAHRLVVLPDFQGMGVGKCLLNAVAAQERGEGNRFSLVSSHPAMIHGLEHDARWCRRRVTRCGHGQVVRGRRVGSVGRMTASYLYVGESC